MILRTGINRRLIVNGEETPYFDHVYVARLLLGCILPRVASN